jgi:hypothetical protein
VRRGPLRGLVPALLPVLLLVLLLVLGAATGIAAVMVHQRSWGLPLALAAVAAGTVAVPPGWCTRLPFALGLAVVLGLAMTERGAGDYLVPANTRGYLLLGLGFLVVLTAVTTLPRPGRVRRMQP